MKVIHEMDAMSQHGDGALFDLLLLTGASRGVRSGFSDTALLGRHPAMSFPVSGASAALIHALIAYNGAQHVLMDVGSITGTRLNGIRLTAPHPLMNGDIISLGSDVHLVYLHPL